jgi:type I restriction enzyme R subunit
MSDRPAIPVETQRDLLFECRYRCACDCEPVSLEKAHIIPWSKTKDHSFDNLVVLCANCQTRADTEKWPVSQLKRFKDSPYALERDRILPVSPDQKAMIDMIAAAPVDSMTDKQRTRLVRMTAAYADVSVDSIRVVDVAPTNSSLVRIEMPRSAAERVILGFQSQDPRLISFLDDFASPPGELYVQKVADGNEVPLLGPDGGIKLIETARPTPAEKPPVTNVKEEGLESLIFDAMTAFGWIEGVNKDYNREFAVDVEQNYSIREAASAMKECR